MKQILTAGVIALGIHGLLLCLNFKWTESLSLERPKSRVLNMTLASLPMKTTPKSEFQPPNPVLKEPAVKKKKMTRPERKHVIKSLPKKKIQIPVNIKNKDVTGKTLKKSEQTFETTATKFEPEQKVSKEFSEKNEQNALTPSPTNVIQEARPIYRSNPPPTYPRIARIRGYQGDVMLDVLVNKDGTVGDLKVIKSSGYPLLDRAAKSSVKNWLFEPGMVGNEKLKMWVRVPIRFELK
jgi:protein TonB